MPLPGRRRTAMALASPGRRRWAKPGAGGSRRGGGGALCGVGAGVRPSGRRRAVSAGVGAAALCERGSRGGGALASGRRRPVRRGVRGGPGRWPAKVAGEASPSGPGGGGAESLERVCACVCALAVCAAGGPRGGRPLGGVTYFRRPSWPAVGNKLISDGGLGNRRK
jgi:hypothetical protein